MYDTGSGYQQAETSVPCGELPRIGATYRSTSTAAGIGPLILTGNTLTVANNATVTAVDLICGTAQGDSVTNTSDGTTTALPDGTLIPAGQTDAHLLVVDSDQSTANQRLVDRQPAARRPPTSGSLASGWSPRVPRNTDCLTAVAPTAEVNYGVAK